MPLPSSTERPSWRQAWDCGRGEKLRTEWGSDSVLGAPCLGSSWARAFLPGTLITGRYESLYYAPARRSTEACLGHFHAQPGPRICALPGLEELLQELK